LLLYLASFCAVIQMLPVIIAGLISAIITGVNVMQAAYTGPEDRDQGEDGRVETNQGVYADEVPREHLKEY